MADISVNNKKIARNTAFLYIRMILVLAITLYTSRLILRTLGVVDYGIYNVVAGFVSMFAFMNVSLTNGVQRYYNYALGTKQNNGVQNVYITSLTIQVLIALIAFLLVETIGVWYMETQMVIPSERMIAARWIFQFSVISLLVLMLQIPYSAAIMSYERMDYFAFVGVLDVVLKMVIVFLVTLSPFDNLILYGCLLLLISILNFVLYFIYSKKHFHELRLKRFFDRDLFCSMLGFSSWNVFGTFAFMLKGQGTNMVLNLFFGPIVNAANGIAASVMSGVQGFSANILVAFRPQLVQEYAAGNYGRVKSIFYSESKISYILLSVIVLPIIIEIDYVLNVWLGADMVPEYAASFTVLVLLNMLVSAFHQPYTHIIHATGKQKTFQLINTIVIFAIIPISWFALKLGYGPDSVFIISLILTILNIALCLFAVKAVFDFSITEYLQFVVSPSVIVSLVIPIIPFAMTQLLPMGFLRLCIVFVTEVIIAIPIIYYLGLSRSEKDMIKNIINHKIKNK